MKLTDDQMDFLDCVCGERAGNWTLNSDGKVDVIGNVDMGEMLETEIPVKFGRVYGTFDCSFNKLTSLKNCPDFVGGNFECYGNNLTDYFKSIKEEDFSLWGNLDWYHILEEYPFLINKITNRFDIREMKRFLNEYPLTKLHFKG